jgi:hypothetical protein
LDVDASSLDPLHQPRHVFAKHSHGSDAFFILLHLANLPSDPDIPIDGAGDDHFADKKEMIDGVKGMDCPAPADGNDGGARLALKPWLERPRGGGGNRPTRSSVSARR